MENNTIFCPYLRMMAYEESDPALRAMPQHQRSLLDYELFMLRRGRGRSYIDERTYDLAPGSLYLVQPGVPHYHDFFTRSEFYYIHLDVFYSEHRELSYVVPWSARFNNDDLYLRQAPLDVPYVAPADKDSLQCFENLLAIYQEAGPLWRLRSQGLMLQLLDPFLRGESQAAPASSLEQRLQRAIMYMRSNVHQHLSLVEIANAAHLSEYYFLRSFKKHYQISPSQYHMKLRLEEAAYRLRHGQESIQEIADALGFKTPFHFSRCFKAEYQASPRAYRNA